MSHDGVPVLSTGEDRATPLVVLSARLAPVTNIDRCIERHAHLEVRRLATEADIVANGADADVLVLGAVEPFGDTVLTELPRLRAIVRRGVGIDNVNIDLATELGIVVANVPDASVDEVAEHSLALLLAVERGLEPLHRAVLDGAWERDPAMLQAVRLRSRRICDLTLAVIGLGRIGRAVARRAGGLYARVLGVDPYAAAGDAVELVTLDEALAAADHVSLHVPMGDNRRHMIGTAELARMRPGAVLVNTARGGLVDAEALAVALRRGHLGGAGIDVTDPEPLPRGHVLLSGVPNLLVTGHSAAWSASASTSLVRRSVDAAIDLVQGRVPPTVVNDAVLTQPSLRLRTAGDIVLTPTHESQER